MLTIRRRPSRRLHATLPKTFATTLVLILVVLALALNRSTALKVPSVRRSATSINDAASEPAWAVQQNQKIDPQDPPGTQDRATSRVIVIGAGYSGLSAACELRRLGHDVLVLEKNDYVGGRAHQFEVKADNGQTFKFDAGPSWYWMPEVFDRFFARYGRKVEEFYTLERLDPAYRIIRSEEEATLDVPGASEEAFLSWARKLEGESKGGLLDRMMDEAKEKYEEGIFKWIWHPMVSIWEMVDFNLMRAPFQYDMFNGYLAHLQKYISNSDLLTALKWPVIFLGASPHSAPAMYSLMTYGGHALGTYYPSGGLSRPVMAMAELAEELGAEIRLNAEVDHFELDESGQGIRAVCMSDGSCVEGSGVVASADYHHVEQNLLPPHLRRYSEAYWDSQIMSPSCLLFYLGFDRSINGLLHHTFFFDIDLDKHLRAAFADHTWSTEPAFYVSATSKTDPSVTSGDGDGEALFVLVPVSYQLNGTDSDALREELLNIIMKRMEQKLDQPLREWLVYSQSYGMSDFENDFHSFRGNAFGHANTLAQSLVLKPSMDSLATNLVFAGHLTNPGPGVPPAIVSGAVSAELLHNKLERAHGSAAMYSHFLSLLVGLFSSSCVVLYLCSTRIVSYIECVKLLYEHGRTYFAAATLMSPLAFLDTAAMYGLFRVADDYVDNTSEANQRQQNLDAFIADFWNCWERKQGDYNKHPTLPAIIESAHRRGYPKELFDRFFRSMRMDSTSQLVCRTMDDTMAYMEGSAAVIGEFMLPILMPDATPDVYRRALPHARDLGLAFQITNMLRDIGEDYNLGRQYIPVEICKRHGIDGPLVSHHQPGFSSLMEDMFSFTDHLYASADIGIGMLPEKVRDVIRVARIAYHRIHDKIRQAEYDIFSDRRRVPLVEKLGILVNTVPASKLIRIAVTEIFCATIYLLTRPYITLVWFGAFWASWFSWPQCTYLKFHLVFIIPPLTLLMYNAYQRAVADKQLRFFRRAVFWGGILCIVATVYTTPWDNYLVYSTVWNYPPERILFVLGYVPIEEYMFFSLETMLVVAVWLHVFKSTTLQEEVQKPARGGGILPLLGLMVAWCVGFYMLQHEQTLYMGLILSWGMPVLILQWVLGAHVLQKHVRPVTIVILCSFSYLCIVDTWAIQQGIWHLSSRNLLQPVGNYTLPLEEALFFLVTSTMCTWGLTLAIALWGRHIGIAISLPSLHAQPRRTHHMWRLTHIVKHGVILFTVIAHPSMYRFIPVSLVTCLRFLAWTDLVAALLLLSSWEILQYFGFALLLFFTPYPVLTVLIYLLIFGAVLPKHGVDSNSLPLYKKA